jgi:sporulation delaying protein B
MARVSGRDAVPLRSSLRKVLDRLGTWAARYARGARLWTNVYGLSRTLLALSTAGTLLFNNSGTLFTPVSSPYPLPLCLGLARISLFCLFPPGYLGIVRFLAAFGLLIVASGWRPRWTGILHWWLSLSFALSAATPDGGDQLAADLALLLVPVTLTDRRRWHWDAPQVGNSGSVAYILKVLIAASALTVVRIQVAAVYFHAAIAKFRVEEWRDGTALYYWFTNPIVGAKGIVAQGVAFLAKSDTVIPLMTWGSIGIEVLLFMALLTPKKSWAPFLFLGVTFHLFIALFFGLTSFSMVMTGALLLYLRPPEKEFFRTTPVSGSSLLLAENPMV